MDDNLPNQNDPPPPFGTHFDPHSNSQDPNNPYQTQPPPVPEPPSPPSIPNSSVHSEVAQHRPRDAHGHFLPYEHPTDSEPQVIHNSQTTPNSPPPISLTENTKYSERNDPPMLDVKVTNPVTYFKKWVYKFFKNQDIDLHLRIKPFATIGLVLAFTAVGGTTFSIGRYLFPNSSPILHRQVVYPGTIQKGDMGYYLMYNSSPWKLKPKNNINLSNLLGKPVIVTGNLTAEPNLIEVSEVIVSDTQP